MRMFLPIILIQSACFGAFAEAQITYAFSNAPIDVVIPCVEKDLATLDLCINGIKKNGQNIRRIIVVSKKELTKKAEWFSEKEYPFSFEDVGWALANDNPLIAEKLLKKDSRTGWYFQQLLKLYAIHVIPGISENVLVIDADTIFLNPVTFLNELNGGLYNLGKEYHLPYFIHGSLLIPGFTKLNPDYSGISHHMIFQKPVIEELFTQIETTHLEPFWKIFCNLVEKADSNYFAGASEYEIYFNYVFSRTNQTSIRKLRWKNISKINDIPKMKKKGYHYVSIHDYRRKK